MATPADKYASVIDAAVERLISRAENARGLTAVELRPRITAALEKYIFVPQPKVERSEVETFIDELRSDDLCLIMACERGDEQAWADLTTEFGGTIKAAAYKSCRSADEAEDLVGSVWGELYGLRQNAEGKRSTRLAYYTGRGKLGGFLHAVVCQLAVDSYRKGSRYVLLDEDHEMEGLATAAASNGGRPFLTASEDPEEAASSKLTAADIRDALAAGIERLDAEDRLILKLYYFDDVKLKGLAASFGFHEATASRRLARLQAELRATVEGVLRERHGWTDTEIKRYLSDAATSHGLDLETMFAVLAAFAMMQEIWTKNVL